MAEVITSYIIENDKAFKQAIDRLAKATDDFRIPFGLIAKDFYRDNKKIFSLKGPGLYPDLSEQYKKTKKRQVGFIYPMLVKSGELAASLLKPNASGSVRTLRKDSIQLGTNTPYAKFHQSDAPRTKLPQRKVVFIDGGPLESSKGASTSGRRERWIAIIDTYIKDNIEQVDF